ncbi:MAG TPA: hypothetical protein VLC09_20670 [Polyangiaceae bacterium]|nr:hypothetical protein [Polyangiaceae bacterium]
MDYFSRAEELVHALPHLLYMARSHVKLGELVAARELYLRIDQEELAPGSTSFVRDTKKIAAGELEALEPRVPYVSVVVQGAGQEPVRVLRNGVEMPRALVGVPQPMDPGEHSFQAEADGKSSALQKVTVAEGAQETVLLTLRDDPGARSTPASTAPQDSAPASEGPNWLKIGGFTGLGLGVVGLSVGTIFLVTGLDKRGQADTIAACDPGCSASQIDEVARLDSAANGDLTVAAVVGGAGVLFAGAGVTMLVLDGNRSESASGPSVRPWFGLGSAGLRGSF